MIDPQHVGGERERATETPPRPAPEASASSAAALGRATTLARRLRQEGAPPEVMLVRVKDAVRQATPPDMPIHEARSLMEEVVRLSVEAYYHPSGSSAP